MAAQAGSEHIHQRYDIPAGPLSDALNQFAGKIDERDDKLLAYLRERPHTLDELVARGILYPPGVALPWIACAERRSIGMHLAHLMHEGRVCADGDDWVLA